MLSETEISYLKVLLKQDNENWENKSTLEDLFRHCKFTIRKLTRQMAGIENAKIFKKNKLANRENTLQMVYRAEILYQALGDCEKIFKHLSQYLFDEDKYFSIINKKEMMSKEDTKFLKKREILLRRLTGLSSNFLSSYNTFGEKFIFNGEDIQDYLKGQLEAHTARHSKPQSAAEPVSC